MSTTNEYEISYTVSPSVGDEGRAEVSAAVEQVVQDHKGTISHNTEHIRRRLNYPINKQYVGMLRVLQTELSPDEIEPVRTEIRKLDNILRCAIIKTARREGANPEVLDEAIKSQLEAKKPAAEKEPEAAVTEEAPKKKVEVSDEDVEAKIAEALDEEVK